jgi:transposase
MSGFVEGIDRSQSSLFPAELEDYVAEDNLVRAVDAFVDGLDLGKLGFGRFAPLERGRPCYHPATLLKIYIYGYLNRVPSSRRLERECQRNIELIWLTGHLAPDFRPLRISARTTVGPFVRFAEPSWRCAASLVC